MSLRPINDFIVIEETPLKDTTEAGIILPQVAKDQFRQAHGTVKAVGPGKRKPDSEERIPLQVAVGDVVLFTPYSGNEHPDYPGLRLCRESEILLVMADA